MAVFEPNDENAVAEVIRTAQAEARPLAIRGGGTRVVGGEGDGDVLTTRNLTGITLYEPGALTIVARAGTPLDEIRRTLAAEGQHLAFEPMDARGLTGRDGTPTVGGMVAANVSGPRRLQAGACRDCMIGVRFVDGTGRVIRNGGRVMKNVTGLDLVRMMAGSHGTLGVITEVGFKVLPAPAATATVQLTGLDVTTAVAAMTAAMGTPFDVTGAAHQPGGATMLRLEGFEGSVVYRAGALAKSLKKFGQAEIIDGADAWTDIRDVTAFAGKDGAVWRISVKPTDGPRVVEALGGADCLLDWSGGLVWALTDPDFDLRAALTGIPGHATLMRAPVDAAPKWPVFHPEPAPVAALSRGLKAKFDPKGILNPGLMDRPVPEPA
ncbi:glycolate oxidase subunit GlcE [Amaricoccus tamworthensis]|uniref:glycolate oxidase subunit GlcE n=1 Tax=Amaricoccus tamworthensis TaxID=57002 RepID=UPI003C7DF4D3